MNYITVHEASKKWHIKDRQVRQLCADGKIKGVTRQGRSWLIPQDADKPIDGRTRNKDDQEEKLYLLYNTNYCLNDYVNQDSMDYKISKAIYTFQTGEIDEGVEMLERCLKETKSVGYKQFIHFQLSTFYADLEDNSKIKSHQLKFFAISKTHPKFKQFNLGFNLLLNKPIDITQFHSLPSNIIPIFMYAYVYSRTPVLLKGNDTSSLPIYEMIIQELDQTNYITLAIYSHLRMILYYGLNNNQTSSQYHKHCAINMALKYGFVTPLAEFSYAIDWSEIKELDEVFYNKLNILSSRIISNYRLHEDIFNILPDKDAFDDVTLRIAYLLATGSTNQQIAKALGISLYKVKTQRSFIYEVLGITTKDELIKVIIDAMYEMAQ